MQDITQLGAAGLFVYLVIKETFGFVRVVAGRRNGKISRHVSYDVCEERHRTIRDSMIRIEQKLDNITNTRTG